MNRTFVRVAFPKTPNNYYTYATYCNLEVGDTVLCDSSTGLGVAKVTSVDITPLSNPSYILAKLDVDFLRAKLRMEKGTVIRGGNTELSGTKPSLVISDDTDEEPPLY